MASRDLVIWYPEYNCDCRWALQDIRLVLRCSTDARLQFSAPSPLPCPRYAKAGVLLLAERSGQLPPTHTAYLRLLPESLDTPVLWTDSELDLLAHPPVQEKVLAPWSVR